MNTNFVGVIKGEQGVGKTILLLNLAAKFILNGKKICYVTGKETGETILFALIYLVGEKNHPNFSAVEVKNGKITLEEIKKSKLTDGFDILFLDAEEKTIGTIDEIMREYVKEFIDSPIFISQIKDLSTPKDINAFIEIEKLGEDKRIISFNGKKLKGPVTLEEKSLRIKFVN